jgi:hypothetical protein
VKDVLKYGAWIVVVLVLLVLGLRLARMLEGEPNNEYVVGSPIDSGFVPIIKKDYRPHSTPFERRSKAPVRLPRGVKSSDVKRVIIVTENVKTDSGLPDYAVQAGKTFSDSTTVIELKSGEIYVPKEDGKELTVEEFRYVPPILDFGLFGSVGASLGRIQTKFVVSPLVAFSPLQICGTVQLPLAMADLYGVGVGFGVRYGDFIVGAFSHWRFDDAQRQIKVSIHYCIN